MNLMNFEEMNRRYNEGEDSLELTIEKWVRIKDFSDRAFHLSHFQEILRAAVVPVFLCTEYIKQCPLCPIFGVCKQGRSEEWVTVMRVIQAYSIAGDLLPKEPYIQHLEKFLQKLRMCRDKTIAQSH